MLTDKDGEPVVQEVTDLVELDEFVEPPDRTHHDRYAQQSHELPDAAAEATSRALIRIVPLAYGALLGSLADSIVLGLWVGLILGTAFDLNMGEKSMARALLQGLCPIVARLANLMARLMCRFGLTAPAALGDMRCRRGWL